MIERVTNAGTRIISKLPVAVLGIGLAGGAAGIAGGVAGDIFEHSARASAEVYAEKGDATRASFESGAADKYNTLSNLGYISGGAGVIAPVALYSAVQRRRRQAQPAPSMHTSNGHYTPAGVR